MANCAASVRLKRSTSKLGEQHWGVTYTPDSVCALEGSSVDLSCSYKHPGGLTVTESFWFINDQPGVGPVDLQEDAQYKRRVQYYQTPCRMRITGLRASDAQTYKFRFFTDDPDGKYTGSSGVRLSVTGLKIGVLNTKEGGKQLNCSSTCALTNPTYIWYRNEQPVSEQNRAVLYLRDRTVDAGSYSCAVKGHEEIRSAAVCVFEGLQVKVEGAAAAPAEEQTVTLTCSSMCSSQSYSTYTWYRNGQPVSECRSASCSVAVFRGEISYSCAVEGRGLRSATTLKPGDDTYTALNLATTSSSEYDSLTVNQCSHATHSANDTYSTLNPATRTSSEYDTLIVVGELGEKQWGVTYTPDRVCALEGSSVDLSCSYKHPGGLRVIKSFWFINDQHVDLREDDQYKGRVKFYRNPCRMRITGLRASDSQIYKFRFITDDPGGKYIGSSGVSLSVTDLKIEVLNTQGGGKQLICSSTCTLTNPTYIWYRNEQPVSEQNRAVLYLRDRTVDAGSYSCAVKEHEEIRSAAVYSPKETRAVVLPSGERKEGDSVTLTCSSDADPPVLTFNWFKQSVNESLGTGQNYSITNISSQHSGLYYCTALNQLGQHSSAPARLDVFYPPRPPSLSEFNGFNGSITLVCTPKPGDDTYTALNLATTSSSEYDTLTHATHSPSDTYSTLNTATRTSSEYDTLTVVGPPPVQSGAPDEENN
ncbi:hemicentin-1-like [Astyanax mexicanus]|uniref:hemicentin-1-like n=1 Tax=Astyanax mexicanus TaxID=7994 RepID=UPI0020CADD83|nr:hemicentin-1-like [Astyanax mexicanus]